MIGLFLSQVEDIESCAQLNRFGKVYYELACLYPALDPLYTSWEKKYDVLPLAQFFEITNWTPIIAVVLYAVMIVHGQRYFADKPRYNWRYTLAAWNLGLSLFSFMGSFRMVPRLLHNLSNFSFHYNMCGEPEIMYGSGSAGLWAQLFVLSKFPELLDTFFIVIHKKPLIFLHWYHHITVLLFCWHSYVTRSAPGIFFVTMNYSVHAVMYFYYYLMAVRMKPKWFNPMVITVVQIAQMFVGISITLAGFYYSAVDKDCNIHAQNNIAASIMYGSYLFLFCQFFFGRYDVKTSLVPNTKKAA